MMHHAPEKEMRVHFYITYLAQGKIIMCDVVFYSKTSRESSMQT